MATTRLQIETRIRDLIREDTEDTFDSADIINYINDAQKYVATVLHPNYLHTLVQLASDSPSAVNNVALQSDFLKIVGVIKYIDGAADDFYFFPMPVDQVYSVASGLVSYFSGTDRYFYIYNNKIYFSETLSGTTTYFYLKFPANPAADGTAVDLPDNVIDLVVWRATAVTLGRVEMEERSKYYMNMFNQQVQIMNAIAQTQFNKWSLINES